MATRPKGATRPPRARLADRDEYPPLGAPVKVATRSGIVMGPPPRVQLALRSTTSAPTLSIVMPVVVAPVQRAPTRDTASAFARPTPVVQIPEPALAVAAVPEVSLTVPVELSMPGTLTVPALASRALKHRPETAARALSPEAVGSLDSPLSRKASSSAPGTSSSRADDARSSW